MRAQITATLFIALLPILLMANGDVTSVVWPSHVMKNSAYDIQIKYDGAKEIRITADGIELPLKKSDGTLTANIKLDKETLIQVYTGETITQERLMSPIPFWTSVLPPLIAIVLALVLKEVLLSLFLGIFSGTLLIAFYTESASGIPNAFLSVADKYILTALNDKGHLSVILFSMLIGATVSLISRNGGMNGVVRLLSRYARGRRSGQMVTWFLGIAIFFDDYANSLIVGNTMRPVTDKLKISREKLSYLVDSTAAPVAAVALVTTWIGAELGYIEDGLKSISEITESVYSIFLSSLKYSFYPFFTIIFMFLLIWMRRDFGPMLKAERREILRPDGEPLPTSVADMELKDFNPPDNTPEHAYNAVIPVLTVINMTFISLLVSGWSSEIWNDDSLSLFRKFSEIIGRADSYEALLWSSLTSLAVAFILTLSQKLLGLQESIDSIVRGFKTMLMSMIILILAWSLSDITFDLRTAEFLTGIFSGVIPPAALPAITFILAGLVSFSTGTSWGTMAILYPMVLPLSWTVCIAAGFDIEASYAIFYNTLACVLAGAVFGDHCSPISDTTILSSLASSCNHIEHVRTQLPYAIAVGVISLLFGVIPSAMGSPTWLCMITGTFAMFMLIRLYGKAT